VPGLLRVVINEQSGSANGNRGAITVNALHVTAFDRQRGHTRGRRHLVVARGHHLRRLPGARGRLRDRRRWITGPSGARANFGVAGGIKHGGCGAT